MTACRRPKAKDYSLMPGFTTNLQLHFNRHGDAAEALESCPGFIYVY